MVTGQLPSPGSNARLDTLHAIAFEETGRLITDRAAEPAVFAADASSPLPQEDAPPIATADCQELAADLKTVQREVESGISSKAPLALRLRMSAGARPGTHARRVAAAGRDRLVVVLACALLLRPLGGPAPEDGIGSRAGVHRDRVRPAVAEDPQPTCCGHGAPLHHQGEDRWPRCGLVALDGVRFTVVADTGARRHLRSQRTPRSTR